MKFFLIIGFFVFILSACTKKNEKTPTISNPLAERMSKEQELKDQVLKECYASCDYYKKACKEFDNKYGACLSDPKTCGAFMDFNLDKGPVLKPDRVCEKVCQQSFWGGKLRLCDANNPTTDYKTGFVDLILKGKSLNFRSLLFSPTLSSNAKSRLAEKIKKEASNFPEIKPPKVFWVEGQNKDKDEFEIIIYKEDMSCLGDSLIDKLIKKQKQVAKDKIYLDLNIHKKEIQNACNLNNLKFVGEEGVQESDAKITDMRLYFGTAQNGCQVSLPQIRIKMKGKKRGRLLAQSSIENFKGKEEEIKLLKIINKYPELYGPNFIRIKAIRGLFSYQKRNFLISASVSCSDIYEITEFGLIKRNSSSICEEQCL
jgi:hypothetical protein